MLGKVVSRSFLKVLSTKDPKMAFNANLLKHRMPLVIVAFAGVEDCWGAKDVIGGLPCTVTYEVSAFPIDFDKDTPEPLAERLQVAMQQAYDRAKLLRGKYC